MTREIKNFYHLLNALVANIVYGFPSRKLTIIGVTGTDGKTTTVNLINHILVNAELNISMISTVGASIEGYREDIGLHVTTPSAWTIQKLLRRAANTPAKGKKYVVLEVTSHAIDQYRTWGVGFDIAALTNITNEHLDYHRTYENYVNTKLRLLKKAKICIVNKDDESYRIIREKLVGRKVLSYSVNTDAMMTPFLININNKALEKFNLPNLLAASLVCKFIGVDIEKIEEYIKTFVLPKGRQEIAYEGNFRVMVDFAHTPNSFERILSSIELEGGGKIVHVFGCAGQRDKVKRPVMGQISAKYADTIILTAEDPRGEKAEDIINEIEMGITAQERNSEVFKISDRAEAIAAAVKMARGGDFVLITGKGHEKSMNIGGREIPWSDEEIVKKTIEEVVAMRSEDG